MQARCRGEAGDSLVEIVFALVLIGIIAAGFYTAVMTSASASRSHRDMVTADAVLRDYAETAKQAVRVTCTTANAGSPFTVGYTPPTGFGVSATGVTCPAAGDVNDVAITATTPIGITKHLNIEVRTP